MFDRASVTTLCVAVSIAILGCQSGPVTTYEGPELDRSQVAIIRMKAVGAWQVALATYYGLSVDEKDVKRHGFDSMHEAAMLPGERYITLDWVRTTASPPDWRGHVIMRHTIKRGHFLLTAEAGKTYIANAGDPSQFSITDLETGKVVGKRLASVASRNSSVYHISLECRYARTIKDEDRLTGEAARENRTRHEGCPVLLEN